MIRERRSPAFSRSRRVADDLLRAGARRRLGAPIGRGLVVLALVVGASSPVGAQTGAPVGLPTITVRPSGVERPEATARDRLDDLVRRRDEDAYRLRWICTHCAGAAANRPGRQGTGLGGGEGGAE